MDSGRLWVCDGLPGRSQEAPHGIDPRHPPTLSTTDTETTSERRAELDAVRRRRGELRSSLNVLELCLAAPASGREVVWGENVHDALVTLAGDFALHVEVNCGPGGLHAQILEGDLRLANAVHALTAEHDVIAAELASLVADSDGPLTSDGRAAAARTGDLAAGHAGPAPAARRRTGLRGLPDRHRRSRLMRSSAAR